jgi:hypothetical protein
MFNPMQFLQFLFGTQGHTSAPKQQVPSGGQSVPVGTIDPSRAGYGVPDASGGLISPILQGGTQQQGTDFVRASAPALPDANPEQQSYAALQGTNYPQGDYLQPANPNRGNDLNTSAPSGIPFDVRQLQNIYASLFGKKR